MLHVRKRLLLPAVLSVVALVFGVVLLLTGEPPVAHLLWASGVISSIIVAAVLLRNDIGALARTSHVARNGIWFGATGVVLALIWTAFALTVGSSPLLWLLYAGISMTLVSLTISWISAGDEA